MSAPGTSCISDEQLTRTVIVLVRARNPANIGAVARAMHDFGFPTLRVVNEFPVPFEAAKSAVDASAVLSSATTHTTLAEAIADCTLIVGTTAVGERELRHELLILPEAAPRIHTELASPERRTALLFGSEKTGLSNDELSFCHFLLTIPMVEHEGLRHPSMNLGQAVAVCLWELVRHTNPNPAAPSFAQRSVGSNPLIPPDETTDTPADSASLERLHSLLAEILEATEYTRRHAANCDPAHIRRLIRRVGVDAIDAPVWMGILRQVLWKLGSGNR
ncbi:MAG TPA: RNA methyltransferase [Acidobacteriaceae bacterium]|jgi:tRNA/rRNA methyltransferase|nr:RNA methyltransferase [Acidobacteriaceae bacterium]